MDPIIINLDDMETLYFDLSPRYNLENSILMPAIIQSQLVVLFFFTFDYLNWKIKTTNLSVSFYRLDILFLFRILACLELIEKKYFQSGV